MHPHPQTSKTSKPIHIHKAIELNGYLKNLDPRQLVISMKISNRLASTVHNELISWQAESESAAIDTFLGDIYSGLQVPTWSQKDRNYAQTHLRILSGLYGILRPLDGISPYRLEMGYKLPGEPYKNLYDFWASEIAKTIQDEKLFVNLAAIEYSKVITDHHKSARFISPKFLTISAKTNEPTFVVVHTKIARGAFARWMIRNQIKSIDQFAKFSDCGYEYSSELSSINEPVFICKEFKGLGLSVRLKK